MNTKKSLANRGDFDQFVPRLPSYSDSKSSYRRKRTRWDSRIPEKPFNFERLPEEIKLHILSFTEIVNTTVEERMIFMDLFYSKGRALCPAKRWMMGDIFALFAVSKFMNTLVREVFFRYNQFQIRGTVPICNQALLKASEVDLQRLQKLHILMSGVSTRGMLRKWVGFLQHLQ